jgi:hypothetical protein
MTGNLIISTDGRIMDRSVNLITTFGPDDRWQAEMWAEHQARHNASFRR